MSQEELLGLLICSIISFYFTLLFLPLPGSLLCSFQRHLFGGPFPCHTDHTPSLG